MADPVERVEQARQIWMTVEAHAEQIVNLTLGPVCARPKARQGWDQGLRIIGKNAQAKAAQRGDRLGRTAGSRGERNRREVIRDLKARTQRMVVHAADVHEM